MDKRYEAGRIMLFSVGIFMILRGVIDIIFSNIYTYYNILRYNNTGSSFIDSSANDRIVGFLFFSSLVICIYYIILGILGIVYSKTPAKGKLCFSLAIVLLIMIFIQSFYPGVSTIAEENINGLGSFFTSLATGVISTIGSAALPVLFMIGARLNTQSLENASGQDNNAPQD